MKNKKNKLKGLINSFGKTLKNNLVAMLILSLVVGVGSASAAGDIFNIENYYEAAPQDDMLGGSIYNRLISFDAGIAVNGTTVIDSSGNWDGAVTASTGTFSSTLAVTGATTLSSTLAVTGASTLTGALTVNSNITATGTISLQDDQNLIFGNDTDWFINYDESVDNQLLIMTNAAGAAATTDPMVEVLATTTPTADQQLFGVAKGSQASNTSLFTVDEDGDVLIAGTLDVTSNASVGGTFDVTGTSTFASYLITQTAVAQTGATSTVSLTGLTSGQTYLLSATGTIISLPDVASTAGVHYRFQVNGAIGVANMEIQSAEGDNIEGTLIVAGAVVDCDAEDQINFIVDGENLGDYFEIMSDGTQWLLLDSGALTGGKLTCTDPS